MVFLNEILKREKNEKPYLLMPNDYPVDGVKVQDITKKPLNEIKRVAAVTQQPPFITGEHL